MSARRTALQCATALVVAAGACASPGAAAAATRSLFVGIDDYAFVAKHPDNPDFHDIKGAVNDVGLIKTALSRAYGLAVDIPPALPACPAVSGDSVTLLQGCATRVRIMGALNAMVNASRKGDLILFYFAGHGATLDDPDYVKPNRKNSTILQADARLVSTDPRYQDIVGPELALLINAASARGVDVVTIFDSCSSGTASRALAPHALTRAAPPYPAKAERRPVVDPGNSGSGYIVHFAAAADNTVSNELPMAGDQGKTHGVFTWALARTLMSPVPAGRAARSYQDIYDDTARTMSSNGFPSQSPTSEGDLSATFLGRNADATRTVRLARLAGGGIGIESGALSGVTIGSVYGLFANNSDAAGDGAPSIKATVTSVGPYSATLSPDSPPGSEIGWARELDHKLADQSLRVEIRASEPLKTTIGKILGEQTLVKQVETDPRFIIVGDAAGVHFLGVDGSTVGEAGDPKSDQFAARIGDAVRKVAEYEAILTLYRGATGAAPTITLVNGAPDTNDPDPTPMVKLTLGDSPTLALTNTAKEPRHLYLLDLEPDYSVNIIYPRQRHTDDVFPPKTTSVVGVVVKPSSVGQSQLLLLSTRDPIDVASFRQSGIARSLTGAPNALERLLIAAKAGRRSLDASTVVVDWSASMAKVDVAAK